MVGWNQLACVPQERGVLVEVASVKRLSFFWGWPAVAFQGVSHIGPPRAQAATY